MDVLSIIGIVLAFTAVVGGNLLEGGELSALANLPAALLVVGGTVGAGLLQMPLAGLRRALAMMRWVFVPPRHGFGEGVKQVVRWATTARREGLLGLEAVAELEPDAFARRGLQLLVDGNEPEAIRSVLESESGLREQRDVDAAKFYESMGGYAPTIGIIGAVVGLIHVMGNLADPANVGPGIAVAFVATIYGVALANLFFLPIAAKLRSCVREAAQYREMIIEGIIAIADGENPRAIELRLNGYLE
ncbi:MAG TPA: flagellar motor protein [Pseudomonadales bacterium]|nr:flagellar motor protein [Pseudomonadales bacterium]